MLQFFALLFYQGTPSVRRRAGRPALRARRGSAHELTYPRVDSPMERVSSTGQLIGDAVNALHHVAKDVQLVAVGSEEADDDGNVPSETQMIVADILNSAQSQGRDPELFTNTVIRVQRAYRLQRYVYKNFGSATRLTLQLATRTPFPPRAPAPPRQAGHVL